MNTKAPSIKHQASSRIRDIGKLQGPFLVFGGVYSNLQALVALTNEAEALGIPPENIVCTGDVVAYCAQAAACVDLIRSWGVHTICGNVELNLLDQADDCGCNFDEGSRCDLFSRQWYPYAQSQMTKEHLAFLETIPHHLRFEYNGKKVVVVHGTFDNVSGYVFKSTDWAEKAAVLNQVDADVVLAGHCGLPFIDKHEEQYWINAGVIGMPANDGQSSTWYCLINEAKDGLQVAFKTLVYDYKKTADLMLENGLPKAYAETLKTGVWDNCEILPTYETQQQGKKLIFEERMLVLL